MRDQVTPTKHYEIRLLPVHGKVRLFVTAVATDQEAEEYANVLLLRHADCESAEIWCGMKLIRTV